MIENQKLINLLVKIEDKIDCFLGAKSIRIEVAEDIKKLIKEKLSLIKNSKQA